MCTYVHKFHSNSDHARDHLRLCESSRCGPIDSTIGLLNTSRSFPGPWPASGHTASRCRLQGRSRLSPAAFMVARIGQGGQCKQSKPDRHCRPARSSFGRAAFEWTRRCLTGFHSQLENARGRIINNIIFCLLFPSYHTNIHETSTSSLELFFFAHQNNSTQFIQKKFF